MTSPVRSEASDVDPADAPSRSRARMTPAPAVTVVVVHWGDPDVTARCLESLRGVEYDRLDVVVVDNGSRAGREHSLRATFPEVEFQLPERNLGYTGGGNLGIRHALERGADYVLLLNNDTEVEPAALERLVRTAEADPRCGAVAPMILYHDDPSRVWYGGGRLDLLRAVGTHRGSAGGAPDGEADGDGRPGAPEEVTFLTGCCLLLPAPVLRKVGGLAEEYFAYVEDAELCFRLLEGGYRLLYEPRARILHATPLPPHRPNPLQIHLRDRNRRRFARQHLRGLRGLGFACWFYPTRVVRLLQYAVRGDASRARAILSGMGLAGSPPEAGPSAS